MEPRNHRVLGWSPHRHRSPEGERGHDCETREKGHAREGGLTDEELPAKWLLCYAHPVPAHWDTLGPAWR